MKKYITFIQEHWSVLLGVITAFWAFVTALWTAFVMPVIDNHIDTRVLLMAKDSLGEMVDNHLKEKGGFRGSFSQYTGIPKDSVSYVLASLYNKEKKKEDVIDTLLFSSGYQHSFDEEIMKMICTRESYRGVLLFVAPTGDAYYKDNKGYIWSANYSAADDCYYYYPPYNNNRRTKCI